MKNLFLIFALAIGTICNAQVNVTENSKKEFDINKFQEALTKEMYTQFYWMTEDTTLNAAARAKSQKDAGSPICYGSKYAGMVDQSADEVEEAKKAVQKYKEYLYNSPYFGEKGIKEYYVEFAAQAIPWGYDGSLIRYGFIVDANVLVGSAKSTSERRD